MNPAPQGTGTPEKTSKFYRNLGLYWMSGSWLPTIAKCIKAGKTVW